MNVNTFESHINISNHNKNNVSILKSEQSDITGVDLKTF